LPDNISDTRFFFYSNILISKGINLYIELFENNHNLKKGFSIIAGYPNEEKLVEYVKKNNHKYIGHINRHMKSNLFLNNHCIIFTSPNEGSPLILLEAMASGVFIISSNVGFIPELLGIDYPFMCNPTINDFSNIIDKFFQLTEKERYQIIFKQRERYRKLFSFEIWHKKTNFIFTENLIKV